jgi:hypothetical protein
MSSKYAMWGFLIGLVGLLGVRWLEILKGPTRFDALIPLGLAIGAIALCQMVCPTSYLFSRMSTGGIFGAAITSVLIKAINREKVVRWPWQLTFAATFVYLPDHLGAVIRAGILGPLLMPQSVSESGSLIAIAGLVVGALVLGVLGSNSKSLTIPVKLVSAVLLALAAVLVGYRVLEIPYVGWVSVLGVLSALVVDWALAEEKASRNLEFLMSVLVWLGLGTISFGLLKGFGMSLGLLTAGLTLLLFGSILPFMSLSPLIALTLYRDFRTLYPDVTQALEINQQYALIGIIVGVVATLFLLEWGHSLTRALKPQMAWASLLAGLFFLGLTATTLFLTGTKGAVGLIVGFGLAPVMAGIIRQHIGTGSVLISLIGSLYVFAKFEGLRRYMDLLREDKARIVFVAVILLMILFFVIRSFTRRVSKLDSEV